MFEIGDRVVIKKLQSRAGTVVDIENLVEKDKPIVTGRYGIKFDNNPFTFSPVYFWPTEIEKEIK